MWLVRIIHIDNLIICYVRNRLRSIAPNMFGVKFYPIKMRVILRNLAIGLQLHHSFLRH